MTTVEIDVEIAIMSAVNGEPRGISPKRLREKLGHTFSDNAIRSTVARLWDEGRLNVGLDKKLRATGQPAESEWQNVT